MTYGGWHHRTSLTDVSSCCLFKVSFLYFIIEASLKNVFYKQVQKQHNIWAKQNFKWHFWEAIYKFICSEQNIKLLGDFFWVQFTEYNKLRWT